jgi:glyoxylase-like metal-dependent hydrolase (beta-lactamase superfamily II)
MKKKKSNLIIKHFESPHQKNEYFLIDGNDAATIDISNAYDEVSHLLGEMGVELKYLLIAHAHKSHVKALSKLRENFGGTFCLHDYELDHLMESGKNLEPDKYLKDNEILMLADAKTKVLLTPGHTKGSVCYYVKQANALFSGSTLLKRGYGKILGPDSMSLMHFSLKRLGSIIPDETVIYSGSGDLTEMKKEGWIHCMRSA